MKVILVIISIVAVMTAANFGMGIFFTDRMIDTVGSDMVVVANTADKLITSEINLLKADAAGVALRLEGTAPGNMEQRLKEQADAYDYILAITVFEPYRIAAAYGSTPAPASYLGGEYLRKAFGGEANISTTRADRDTGALVFDVCVPMAGEKALAVTVPGMLFSDLLRDITVWETGSVFVLDAQGKIIANVHDNMVLEQQNLIEVAKATTQAEENTAFFENMIRGGRGVGRYTYFGEKRLCAYTPITGSKVGWTLGVAAPLSESSAMQVQKGLLLAAGLFLLFGAVAALLASRSIAKPFQKIKEQNIHLEELNEIAKDASEAKNHFLANMSHEMRTPLNAVVGLSELMLGGEEVRGEAAENMEKVYNAGVTLLGIVNDILDLSKIESGKFELVPVEYDVPSLINDTITLNIMRIADKPIQFNLLIDETLPSKLYGDELRIKQICNNLLSNAFKYTEAGRVDLAVACERDGGAMWLVITVTDTGIGIRPDDLKKLFSDYHQVDTRFNRKIEGTGLGLSITKRMAEMMDGEIKVESVYGTGSLFRVRVRQKFVTDVAIGAEVAENLRHFHYSDSKRSTNAKLTRIRIPYARVLVVDDVQTNLDVAKGMLKPYDIRVDCVLSGGQAIDRIREGRPAYSAIFMDHMMPELDGVETTRIIREEIGTDYAKNIPIIALTANAILGNEKMFLENGFQAFLSKPIDIMCLDAVIRKWIRNKELEKEIGEPFPAGQGGAKAPGPFDGYSVDGVDLPKALARFGGDTEALREVLRSYAVNTPPLLAEMRVRDMPKAGLADYAVRAHGIKGSSRGICAERVGALAEALEHAAKAGELGFVSDNNDAFILSAGKLIEDLLLLLEKSDKAHPKPKRDIPDAALLGKLRASCADYDMDGIDEAMKELERFDYAAQTDLIRWLRARIDEMDFQEIFDRLPASA
ncbi:MAG: response regulator [Clostridiales Family XIII bacterium]|nr:response regulator [Clostridiales Family XIII bacterium]